MDGTEIKVGDRVRWRDGTDVMSKLWLQPGVVVALEDQTLWIEMDDPVLGSGVMNAERPNCWSTGRAAHLLLEVIGDPDLPASLATADVELWLRT